MALRPRSLVATISLAVSLGLAAAVSAPRAGPEDAALFVGNFVPNGPTNGISATTRREHSSTTWCRWAPAD